MEKVVIDSSEILSSAWEQAKKNGLALAVIFFVISIIQSAISGAGFDYVAYIEAIKETDTGSLNIYVMEETHSEFGRGFQI